MYSWLVHICFKLYVRSDNEGYSDYIGSNIFGVLLFINVALGDDLTVNKADDYLQHRCS